jgi:hypothetical protein
VRSNLIGALIGMLCLAGCGGGGGSVGNGNGGGGNTPPTGTNVAALVVDNGPSAVASSSSPAVNTLYTTVTICTPGTATCQTIDHIQVDTGSSGLRIISSVLSGTLSLPARTNTSGNPIAECVQFIDGSSWGPLKLADVQIAGEKAGNLAIQIIGDPTYPVPSACSGSGTAENTVTAFGANGILGVGPFIQDCGPGCTSAGAGVYFTCTSTNTGGCADSAMPLNLQISNPVASFAAPDNNGVMIQVGAVSSTAASVSGYLVFGIGTQSNNGLGNAKVFTLDGNGSLTTNYNNGTLNQSFIDSGSNAYYFPDPNKTIPVCASTTSAPGFFCPTSTLNLSGTIVGINGISSTVSFSVANADSLFKGSTLIAAAATLAAPSTSVSTDPGSSFDGTHTFDWGLPFYYGKTVFTAIENQNTSAGLGPYFAF